MLLTPEARRELQEIVCRAFRERMHDLRGLALELGEDVHDNLPEAPAAPELVVERLLSLLAARASLAEFVARAAQRLGPSLDTDRARELVGGTGELEDEAWPLAVSPFIGLRSFTESESALFFGRGRLIETIHDAVREAGPHAVLLVYGLSGVGKSSLIRAGLLPRLRAGKLRCRYERCVGFSEQTGLQCEGGVQDGEAHAVQVIDQFEAVFLNIPPEQRAAAPPLIAHLKQVLETRGAIVILGFRQEFLADVEALLRACGRPPPGRIAIEPMRHADVLEVLAAPASRPQLRRQFRFDYDEGLAADIAADLCRDRASPLAPTLQLLMQELWKRRSDPMVAGSAGKPTIFRITRESYQQFAGTGGYLHGFVIEQLKPTDPAHQDAFTSGLIYDLLWHFTDESTLTSRPRPLVFIRENFPRADVLLAVVDLYCKRGLLVDATPGLSKTESEPTPTEPDRVLRLVHDALVPIVLERCRTSQGVGIRAARVLRTRAALGDEQGLNMMTPEQLVLVEQGIASMHRPRDQELALLTASRRRRASERMRVRVRWALGGLAICVVLVMASMWGWTTLRFAAATRQNLARSLALHAEREVTLHNPRAAVALARRAFEMEGQADGGSAPAVIDRALRSALSQWVARDEWYLGESALRDLHVSPGDAGAELHLLVARAVGAPERWHGGHVGERLSSPHHSEPALLDLDASASGTRVFGASAEGVVYVWDLEGPGQVRVLRPREPAGALVTVAASRDGGSIAAGAVDGRVLVWEHGAEYPRVDKGTWRHTAPVNGVAFLTDDRLASVGSDGCLHVGSVSRPSDVSTSRHGEELHAIATIDAESAVYGGASGALYTFTGTPMKRPQPETDPVWAPVHDLLVGSGGHDIISAHGDGKIRVWQRRASAEPLIARGEFTAHAGAVDALARAGDEAAFMSAGRDGYVRSWDLQAPAGEPISAHPRAASPLRSLRAEGERSPDLLVGFADGCVQRWDSRTLAPAQSKAGCEGQAAVPAALAEQGQLRVSYAAHRLRVDGTVEGVAHAVELASGVEWSLARISMDATTIVAATANGELRSWRHFGGEWQPGPSLRSSGSPIQAAALSPDGQRMVFSDIDGAPYRWELADAYATKHANAYAFVAALAYSPDGRWLAAGGRGANLQIWRWEDAFTVPPIELDERGQRIVDLAFVADGSAIVVATANGWLRRHATLPALACAACELLRRDPAIVTPGDAATAMLVNEVVCDDLPLQNRNVVVPPPATSAAKAIEFAGCSRVLDTGSGLQCAFIRAGDAPARVVLWVPGAGPGQCRLASSEPTVTVVMDDGVMLQADLQPGHERLSLDCGRGEPWVLPLAWLDRPDATLLVRLDAALEATPADKPCDTHAPTVAELAAFWRSRGHLQVVQRCLDRANQGTVSAAEDLEAAIAAVHRGASEALEAGQLSEANAIVMGAVYRLTWDLGRPERAQELLRRHRVALERVPGDRAEAANYLGGIYLVGGFRQQRDGEDALRRSIAGARHLGDRDAEFRGLQVLTALLNDQQREEETELLLARAETLLPATAPADCQWAEAMLAVNKGWTYLSAFAAARRSGDPRPLFERAIGLLRAPACADRPVEELANATANLAYATCLMGQRERAARLRAELVPLLAALSPRLRRFIKLKLDRCTGDDVE